MEYENKYASKGVAGAGLGLGIAGTALGLLNNGGGLNILGANGNGHACPAYTRYDAEKDARIAELETEVKLRDANTYTDSKILELYKDINARFGVVEGQLCEQRVYNATNTAAIGCIRDQVAVLMGLTKTVIPNGSLCPGWGDVTVTINPTTTPAAGA
ncbi:MAG: hypothetical protein J6K29_11980 [Clostridia bacterium]|nr:hypothetical protein [Clostridia bacterium]